MKRLSLVAAAAIATLAAAPAFAATSSSASIGPLSLQLFDLNPLDGVTPWISFTVSDYGYDNYVYASATQTTPYASDSQGGYVPIAWTPASYSATAGVAQADAAIAGPGTAASTTLAASGSAGDFTASYWEYAQYSAQASVHPNQSYGTSFTLSANTLVLITGAASVAAAGTGAGGTYYYYGDYASANVSLNMSGPGASGNGSQSANDYLSVSGYTGYYNAPFSYTDSRILGASFANATGADMSGYFDVTAQVYGYTYAVPEPETYALMLAGLLVVGSLVRRRRA